ncbi:MAG: hypothetical protein AAFX78_01585 [Cyanobacteria bacterium J06638_20]
MSAMLDVSHARFYVANLSLQVSVVINGSILVGYQWSVERH